MAPNEQRVAAGRWLGLACVLGLLALALHTYHELGRPLASYSLARGVVAQPQRRHTTGNNPVFWYVEFRLAGQAAPFRLNADSLALLQRLQAAADPHHPTRVYFNSATLGGANHVVQLENDLLGGVVYSLYDARRTQTGNLLFLLMLLAVAAPLVLRPWLAHLAAFFK